MISENRILSLETLIRTEHAQLKAIGEAWLAAGATSFSVHAMNDELLACFPSEITPDDGDADSVVATIRVISVDIGYLKAAIPASDYAISRLQADAKIVSRMFRFEDEMESMTLELIDSQDQLLALYQLTQSVRGLLDLNETITSLAREAAKLVKVEMTFLLVETPKGYQIAQHPEHHTDDAVLIRALKSLQDDKREILVNEMDQFSGLPDAVDTVFVTPILIQNHVVAALGVLKKIGGFASPDLKLIRAVTEQAGAQLEKVLLYQETLDQARLKAELNVAADIQNRLLPHRLPYVAGLDIYAQSMQAKQVGGDFYDYVIQPGNRVVLTVGDVSGKGMSAALMMAVTRTVMRTRALALPPPSPGSILTDANDDLYDDYTEVNMFTTVFVGGYNPETRNLQFANGGHSPVIYCPANEKAYLLRADNMPMGILKGNNYENSTVTFNIGDVLVIGTDGFSEAINNQHEMYGYDRLLTLVEEHAHESAEAIASAMFSAIDVFSGDQPQNDDQTLMVVKSVETHATTSSSQVSAIESEETEYADDINQTLVVRRGALKNLWRRNE
jgi:sigma-B regulation protein RsbU (phosphoserine phosphatase)